MLHPIPPGLYCVPSAMVALTGADYMSVIFPALNRHAKTDGGILDWVGGVHTSSVAIPALEEMGYHCRRYKKPDLRAKIFTWANRSMRYPDRPLLVIVPGHALVIENGKVYDTHMPHGVEGKHHPYAHSMVIGCWLIERKA